MRRSEKIALISRLRKKKAAATLGLGATVAIGATLAAEAWAVQRDDAAEAA